MLGKTAISIDLDLLGLNLLAPCKLNCSLLITGRFQEKTPSASVTSQAPQEESLGLSPQRPSSLLPSQLAPPLSPLPPAYSASHPISTSVSNSANVSAASTASPPPLYGPVSPVQRKAGKNSRNFILIHLGHLAFQAPLTSFHSPNGISLTRTFFCFYR